MKKYLILLFTALSFSFMSCEETDIESGGTAVEKMAGTWNVTWEAKNTDNGKWEDILGGTVALNTYNTAANVSTEMWLAESYVLKTPLKVTTNYGARTFSMDSEVVIGTGEEAMTVTISDGKVLEGAATTPSRMSADSIVFFVNIKGDDVYKVAGFRRTGFSEDD